MRFLLVSLFFTVTASATDHWLQWRGPSRDGQLPGNPWPQNLDESVLQRVWRVELEPSYSGPIIYDGKIFTTETANKERENVIALDLATGEELWRTGWEGMMKVPFFAAKNGSWIRSTPASDGERLYIAGMRDVLVCLDVTSGRELWRVDFVKTFDTKLPSFGFVSSPLIDGSQVIVQAGASLVCLDKMTGEVRWRSLQDEGGMNGSAFSSPIIDSLHGSRQLLVQTRQEICGVDLQSGKPLWTKEIPAFRGMNILTPIVHENLVFTTAYGGKAHGLSVSRKESVWQCEDSWESKLEGYMSTPVVVDGHAYVHLRNQRMACINLASGEITWRSKKKFGKYMSLVARGSQILALDERGLLYQIEANSESLNIVAERRVSDSPTWAHLAVSGDQLVIRELDGLSVFRWQTSPKLGMVRHGKGE